MKTLKDHHNIWLIYLATKYVFRVFWDFIKWLQSVDQTKNQTHVRTFATCVKMKSQKKKIINIFFFSNWMVIRKRRKIAALGLKWHVTICVRSSNLTVWKWVVCESEVIITSEMVKYMWKSLFLIRTWKKERFIIFGVCFLLGVVFFSSSF